MVVNMIDDRYSLSLSMVPSIMRGIRILNTTFTLSKFMNL